MNRFRRAAVRATLIAKARNGQWDPRMCTLHGVSPEVNEGCRRAIVRGYAVLLIPTSTKRRPLDTGSYHNARDANGDGQAVDIGVVRSVVGTPFQGARLRAFQRSEHKLHTSRNTRLVELLGPINELAILRDRETDLQEGTAIEQQHDDHVHEAYSS